MSEEIEFKETDEEREKRLWEELQAELEEARDLFDEADFIGDLMRPREILIPLPGRPLKLRFCRLNSDESAELRKRVDKRGLDFREELLIAMVKKAYPERSLKEVRQMLKKKLPSEMASHVARMIVVESSVFLPESARRRLTVSFSGSTTTPEQGETQSSDSSGS